MARAREYWFGEAVLGSLLIHNSAKLRRLEVLGKKFMARQVADPDLRAKLTPTYTPGCKRLLQSNDYYPALQRPNVTVATEKIVEVQPGGVVTADGVLHEVDTIIYGTGFRITSNPMAEKIHGADGRSLKNIGPTPGCRPIAAPRSRGSPTTSCWPDRTRASVTPPSW